MRTHLSQCARCQAHVVCRDGNTEVFDVETVKYRLVRGLAVLVCFLSGFGVVLVGVVVVMVAVDGLEELASALKLRQNALETSITVSVLHK